MDISTFGRLPGTRKNDGEDFTDCSITRHPAVERSVQQNIFVIPAKAGIQHETDIIRYSLYETSFPFVIPAFAGMTNKYWILAFARMTRQR